jgi:endonuclease I/V8-like Glu-specific endopeptidase
MLVDYLGRGDWRAAAARWRSVHKEHERTLAMLNRGESPDTASRQIAAARRALAMAPTVAAETGAAKAMRLSEWLGTRGLERVIGRSDFEPGAFLEIGLAVGRAVCLIDVKDSIGRILLRGTGFLAAPGVLVTNNHVLMSKEDAQSATITFDYRNDPYGRAMPTTVFRLNPGILFETDRDHDCTFVSVGERISGSFDITDFGWLPLVGVEGKIEVGDPVNIIQHPSGEPMQWVVRDNRLLALPELAGQRDPKMYAHYEADTMPGSSGAPAMSRLWEVIALHHQAVPAMDADGNVLDLDGIPYAGDDDTRVKWVGNEGIRVTALVRLLAERRKAAHGEQARALDAVLEANRPDYIALAAAAHRRTIDAGHSKHQILIGGDMPGHLEFTLPLKVGISIGEATPTGILHDDGSGGTRARDTARRHDSVPASDDMQTAGEPDAAAPLSPLPASLSRERDEVLRELARSRTRPYYDKRQAETDANAYYAAVDLSNDRRANFAALSELLETTHRTRPRYAPARLLYPWIDLHKEGRRLAIKSIYSGKVFDAREFIDEAFAIEARREAMRASLRNNEAASNMSEAMVEQMLEAGAPYNCEHTVPQSWFSKREPMRGDLHHLFACESRCNSFRGNHAYFDFPDTEATMEQCGRREEDRFEPISGKGAVARATMYFLLRYPGTIDLDISQMTPQRLTILKKWHEGDPVSEYERHRNQAIFEVQGNRNPFIDHPEWVSKLAFESGLQAPDAFRQPSGFRHAEGNDVPCMLQKRSDVSALKARDTHIHVFGKGAHIVCDTEPRGYALPENRSLLEHRLHQTEGIVPLWEQGQTLRWRFQERSLLKFARPDQLKSFVRQLFGEALAAWGDAAPIRFSEQDDAWDFEISVRSEKDCDIGGCVAASAFFPDEGRHEFVIYPSLFELDRSEQIETLIHETGHIFGLRHWFANITETAWPSVEFGSDSQFTIMNYGEASMFTEADKADLARLYATAWSGVLAGINGTPIRFVRPYHVKRYVEDEGAASRLLQPASAPRHSRSLQSHDPLMAR